MSDESEAMSIVNEIAEDLGVDIDNLVMPQYKVEALYEEDDEEWFRDYMRRVLQTLQ